MILQQKAIISMNSITRSVFSILCNGKSSVFHEVGGIHWYGIRAWKRYYSVQYGDNKVKA